MDQRVASLRCIAGGVNVLCPKKLSKTLCSLFQLPMTGNCPDMIEKLLTRLKIIKPMKSQLVATCHLLIIFENSLDPDQTQFNLVVC